MANAAQNVGIKNSWSFVNFAKTRGQIKLGTFVSPEGEEFKSLVFVDANNEKTFVGFSSKLGELNAKELKAQKDDLQVVQLESGTYKLCRQGDGGWEDVDIF